MFSNLHTVCGITQSRGVAEMRRTLTGVYTVIVNPSLHIQKLCAMCGNMWNRLYFLLVFLWSACLPAVMLLVMNFIPGMHLNNLKQKRCWIFI